MDNIVALINTIGLAHEQFSREFYGKHMSKNLKKTTLAKVISDTDYDNQFIDSLKEYYKKIVVYDTLYSIRSDTSDVEFRHRIKTNESILNKLYYYAVVTNRGNYPILKCLNDIAGFRLIVDSSKEYKEILESIVSSPLLEVELFRPYVREDDGYSAIHLYLKSSSNYYLPWEVQIWKKILQNQMRYHIKIINKRELI